MASTALVLTVAAAPAQARSADPAVDPATLAAFQAAAKASYYTAWARDGGTYTDRCNSATEGRSSSLVALDTTTRTKLHEYRFDGFLPSTWINRGHTSYTRVPAAVRKSLRVHGVKPPARWLTEHTPYVSPGRHDALWADEDEGPFEVEWLELSQAPASGGGSTFTGSYESGWSGADKAVHHLVFTTDASGRFLSYTSATDQVTGTTTTRVLTCTSRWTWSRPQIALPKHSAPDTLGKRLKWERAAVGNAKRLAWIADRMLAQGATATDVVDWLHAQVPPGQHRVRGIVYVLHKKDLPPMRYKIVLRHGAVDYRPIR